MPSNTMPFFSIIIPVYNKEKSVERSLQSVMAQTFTDWELVIVNDGSKDQSKEVIARFNDPRIRYFEHSNHGVSFTRNAGLQVAIGKYVHFLDADDYLAPDRLQHLYDAISTHEADIYFTGITSVSTQGEMKQISAPYSGYVSEREFKSSFYRIETATSIYGYVPTKIIRRSFYLEHNLFFDESLRLSEDFDLFLRCYQKATTFFFVHDYGYYYVHYTGGTSMFSRNVDYFSLIDIQRKVFRWLEDFMREDDHALLNKKVAEFAHCAIFTLSPFQVSSIPAICQRMEDDQWLYERVMASGTNDWVLKHVIDRRYWLLMCYVFIKQSYIRLYQKLHR